MSSAGRLLKLAGLTALLGCLAFAQQGTTSGVSLSSIVQQVETTQSEVRPEAPYQIIREYRLLGAKSSGADAEVVAELDFNPPASKGYNIRRWSGSARGKQVVERILDHEVETAASESLETRTGLTRVNYDFSLVWRECFGWSALLSIGAEAEAERERFDFGESMGGQEFLFCPPY